MVLGVGFRVDKHKIVTAEFKSFYDRFNRNDSNAPELELNIQAFEKEYQINFPKDFREFIAVYGDLWTPDILDLIDDNKLDINDVQDFWSIERIKYDKENGWTSKLETDLIPFASDCMGNIFVFKREELKDSKEISNIYFFDHDFDVIDFVSSSFTEWIKRYLIIKE